MIGTKAWCKNILMEITGVKRLTNGTLRYSVIDNATGRKYTVFAWELMEVA